MTIEVHIVSSEAEVFSGTAEIVFAPAVNGEVGIMPSHSPLLSPLRPGEVRIKLPEGKEESFYVSGGILEVQPHMVTVLSDTGLRARDIDEAMALEAKERAETALKDRGASFDYAKAQVELAEAIAQLQVLQRLRKRLMK
ncbi:MAG: F0F1 ATP synthase subunit epsilon [Gammaproteobacteria bacterium]|nr:F0F1 ATP synthase subunit epsilon [Gammaproteobacteria bacterium]